MTLRVVLSPRAQADIDGIWDYTAERWGISQATQYTRDIATAVERIAENPLVGSDREKVRAGYRKINSGSHSIYYLHTRHQIEVVRILQIRMDSSRAFDR